MDSFKPRLLLDKLTFSETSKTESEAEWELLLRQAYASDTLARLSAFSHQFKLFTIPQYAESHFLSADKYWLSQKRIVAWELFNLVKVFEQLRIPLILLKGTAYSAAGLNAGLGRIFSDIDILVPKQSLHVVKEALKWSGWFPDSLTRYDQYYYERWMHEMPPMHHIQRGTSLDVHHNIVPQTCALCPDASLLLDAAVRVPNTDYWTLSREDMVLHSATHLFWGGEFEHGLRDLSDLDLLLREFSQSDAEFWSRLLNRAGVLGLGQPLFYALRYTAKLLATPVPKTVLSQAERYAPSMAKTRIMDFLFCRVLLPFHPSCVDKWTGLARWSLYVRSHWLKMPWYLLLPHLLIKAWMRIVEKESSPKIG